MVFGDKESEHLRQALQFPSFIASKKGEAITLCIMEK